MVYPESEPKNTVKPSENDDKTKAEVNKTTEVSVKNERFRAFLLTNLIEGKEWGIKKRIVLDQM